VQQSHVNVSFVPVCASWSLAYMDYFLAHHYNYIVEQNYKKQVKFVVLIILGLPLIALFIIHLIRRNLYSIIKERLYQSGITKTKSLVWRLMITNWRFLLLPLKTKEIEFHIAKLCSQIKNKLCNEAIKSEADKI